MTAMLEQEYFSEGIAEDIITNLSRNRAFFCISRSTSFTYTGPAVDVGKVDASWGCAMARRPRRRPAPSAITAQLIRCPQRHDLWADRYDASWADVFAVQDEIALQHHRRDRTRIISAESRRLSARI